MIILITGPSGAGKSTFIHALMDQDPRLAFSVSSTTRPMREGESHGVDYDFVNDAEFDRLLAADGFVEWARVHGHRYGTTRHRLQELSAAGKIPVLDIDVQGGVQVLDKNGDALVSVFLFPPSWEELERRLRSRATDTDEAISSRLATARHEVTFAPRYRYWIVNDDLTAAVGKMRSIIEAEECRARPDLPLTGAGETDGPVS